jgi:hypothetical protein
MSHNTHKNIIVTQTPSARQQLLSRDSLREWHREIQSGVSLLDKVVVV